MRKLFLSIRLSSLALILAAFGLTYWSWLDFESHQQVLPPGSEIAGLPAGGLTHAQIAERLSAAYSIPVELSYKDALIQLSAEQAGFRLNLEAMLPAEPLQRGQPEYWPAFRDYLWGQAAPPYFASLEASVSHDQIRAFLENEVSQRYDQPAIAAVPIPGTPHYTTAQEGWKLDIENAIEPIAKAFTSISDRRVQLTSLPVFPPPPEMENLEIQLEQIIDRSEYDGLTGIFLQDLQTGEEIQITRRQEQEIPNPENVAFTASSVIKIPILVSAFRSMEGPPSDLQNGWIFEMIANSSNPAADALMRYTLDEVRGPLMVTENLQELGFENSFLAGYFEPGSPLLALYETPANTRADVNTQPDLYNQASPVEIGQLLAAIYHCGREGEGLLPETFGNEVTPSECESMMRFLREDRQPYLITAGLPDGTYIAHKHGYGSTASGVINTIGDAGLILSPGGDYALVIFLNNPELLLWDPANELVARLSQAVYNYFNPPQVETAGAS